MPTQVGVGRAAPHSGRVQPAENQVGWPAPRATKRGFNTS